MQVATETQIKASDLRIGNYVAFGVKRCKINSIHTVPETGECFIRVEGFIKFPQYQFDLIEAEPIPLTPEILEKAGFEWETQLKKHLQLKLPEQDINGRKISFYYNDGKCEMLQFYMDDYFDGYFEVKPPEYLHQLQNLFHSLTGEEIQLSL